MDSEDFVATLDITYKLKGTSSGDADEITVDGTLKKCEEDGSYHECSSTPKKMQWTVRRAGNDSVVLKGRVAGTSERTLHLDKR